MFNKGIFMIKKHTLTLLLAFNSGPLLTLAYTDEFKQQISIQALKGLPQEQESNFVQIQLPEGNLSHKDNVTLMLTNMHQALTGKINFTIAPFNESQKFALLNAAESINNTNTPEAIIDTDFVKTMELVCRNTTNTTGHLIDQLTNDYSPYTIFGKKRFTEIITQPTCDTTVLTKRQNIIRILSKDEQLLTICNELLKKIQHHENYILSLYDTQKMLHKSMQKKLYWSFFKNLNKSTLALEANRTYEYFQDGSIFTIIPTIAAIGLPIIGATEYYQANPNERTLFKTNFIASLKKISTIKTNDVKNAATYTFNEIISGAKLITSDVSLTAGAIYLSAILSFTALKTLADWKILNALYRSVQQVTIEIAQATKATQELYTTLAQHYDLTLFPETLAHLNVENTTDTTTHTIIRTLRDKTFQGSPSVFSNMGKVAHMYQSLESNEFKTAFTTNLSAIGELDVYVALAKKIKSAPKTSPYCFASYLTDQQHPSIVANNFYNPFLKNPVLNSITMNHDTGSTIILSGPNTGGKSTITNAIMYNLLLAQTLGIAAASEFVITPFTKLISHRNVSDDIITNSSGYQAELNNVQKMITELKALNKIPNTKQFAFVSLDELFRSTSADQANIVTYKTIKKIASNGNLISIFATHLTKPLELAQENSTVANYRMGVTLNSDGSVAQYTYTLEPGTSHVKNANQLFEKEMNFLD